MTPMSRDDNDIAPHRRAAAEEITNGFLVRVMTGTARVALASASAVREVMAPANGYLNAPVAAGKASAHSSQKPELRG